MVTPMETPVTLETVKTVVGVSTFASSAFTAMLLLYDRPKRTGMLIVVALAAITLMATAG